MFTDTINTSDIILPPWGLINGEKGCQVQSKLAGEFFQTTQADSVNCATQDILKVSRFSGTWVYVWPDSKHLPSE